MSESAEIEGVEEEGPAHPGATVAMPSRSGPKMKTVTVELKRNKTASNIPTRKILDAEHAREEHVHQSGYAARLQKMPRSKETEARMKILVLVTTAVSIIVVFLFTITYPYINKDIGYDESGTDESSTLYCPLLIPPQYGRLDCSSVRSLASAKVDCKVWCDHGMSNATLNSTADGLAGVVLQLTCLDSELWGVSQASLTSLCAAPVSEIVNSTLT